MAATANVKPPKVEAKPNIHGASFHVGGSGVLPLQAHEVDTARFFSDNVKSKDRDELLEWVRRQANKAGFTIVTQRSSLINPMFRLVGYQSKQTKEWGLNILNGVQNHAMELALEGHILSGRLMEDDKKIVRDLTKRKMLPRNILIHLKNKRPHCMTNVKQVYNERQQISKGK
ncbi:hypothetical protein MTR_0116s0050 [Medicago truncatula]|uniref:Uncharacterized protein n=1 Tax=Medicago truncatula TaxID=3880 RepID=A0A072TH23_MEDTR|nr:hypothetical protein MTR_0116s0050 [Medicago truncatula]